MKRVLIIEDDEILAQLCKVNLQKKGYEVDMVHDGELAAKSINTFNPHLVILDIILPNKDGFEILEEIKKCSKHHSLPVIIYTSLSQKEDIDRLFLLGAHACYSKMHVSAHELVLSVNTHIEGTTTKMHRPSIISA